MSVALRWLIALACWVLAGAGAWWWQRPSATSAPAATAADRAASAAWTDNALQPAVLAGRIRSADPMGLNKVDAPTLPAGLSNPVAAAPGLSWRLSALVVRGADRYAVLTSGDAPPLTVKAGQVLPDGDRIKAVQVDRIEIQSPRGRLRTLYLIEP